jgi:hypothetical protein
MHKIPRTGKDLADYISGAAKRLRVPRARIFEQAELAPSTWYRWSRGRTSPTLTTCERMVTAVHELETARLL